MLTQNNINIYQGIELFFIKNKSFRCDVICAKNKVCEGNYTCEKIMEYIVSFSTNL